MKLLENPLVLGGSGFLGKNLQKEKPDWNYSESNLIDLTDRNDTNDQFMYCREDSESIVHLAGRVGGIKDNAENQAEYFYLNTLINTNTINQAYMNDFERVLCSLSTCAFPDIVDNYPFVEEDFFKGPPAETNFSYGFTKRMLHVQCQSYRKQHGLNYSTFCPSNLYGPMDHFDSESSHFVASLISKLYKAKDGDVLEFWGTGKPLRQQLYVKDLCKIIPILLEKHNSDIPLIVAPNENLSIKEMIDIAKDIVNKDIKIVFNGKLDGQFRKDGSNKKLLELIGDFKFTPFKKGFEETYNWYSENYKKEYLAD